MFSLSWNALRLLCRRGWLVPAAESLLAPAAEGELTEAEEAAAWQELQANELLLPDAAGLAIEFGQSIALAADPVVRVRTVHQRVGELPKSLVAETDGVQAVLLGGDLNDVWFSPMFDSATLVNEIALTVCGSAAVIPGPALDVMGLEALALGWLWPMLNQGPVTSAEVMARLAEANAHTSLETVTEALDGLAKRGFLNKDEMRYRRGDGAPANALVPEATTQIVITYAGATALGELRLSFWRHHNSLWQVQPLVVETESAPVDTPLRLALHAQLGLDFLPRSRAQLQDCLGELISGATTTAAR